MDITKSYTCRIDGNIGKTQYLNQQLCVVQELSEYAFSLGKENWMSLMLSKTRCRSKRVQKRIWSVYRLYRAASESSPLLTISRKPPPLGVVVHLSLAFTNNHISAFWVSLYFTRAYFPFIGLPEILKVITLSYHCNISAVPL